MDAPSTAPNPRASFAKASARQANAKFWRDKIARNQARDQPSPGLRLTGRQVNRLFHKLGWRVVRIWEHELKRKDEGRLLRRLLRLAKYSDIVGHLCRSGFTPDMLGNPSVINPDLQSNRVTLLCETQ